MSFMTSPDSAAPFADAPTASAWLIQSAREAYLAKEFHYASLLTEVKFSIASGLAKAGLKIHSVTGRVKELESFLEKIDRKGYDDPFTQAQDLVGVRIVALFMSDLTAIENVIADLFEVVERDDHIDGGPVEEFGYMSIHYICRLGVGHTGPRYADLGELFFEVQIRTIVMDAWANVSHHLGYKGDSTIPDDLRRDFHALSGLFYVADQHFELFANRTETTQARAEQAIGSNNVYALDINLESTLALFDALYPSRKKASRAAISEFVSEALESGYKSIGHLETDLKSGIHEAMANEKLQPPPTSGQKYSNLGLARRTLELTNVSYRQTRFRKSEVRRKAREEAQALREEAKQAELAEQ